MLKRALLALLYASGLFAIAHRIRNRSVLTVVSLHRVLAEADPRWQACDPLYTLSDRLFEQCVSFFSKHYSIVSLDDVIAARHGKPLPARPLLITFDDGWSDNHHYALPILQRLRVPAVIFVASDAIDRHEAFFQERLLSAWRRGTLRIDHVRALWRDAGHGAAMPSMPMSEAGIRELIARLQRVSVPVRRQLLATYSQELADDERQMLTSEELKAMSAAGFAVGTHGKAHEPLIAVTDLEAELCESKVCVARALGVAPAHVQVLSFPFSKQNSAVVERARAAGYELLFGGGLSLTPLKTGVPDLLARVGVTAADVSDTHGNLIAARLAAALFRRPHRPLESQG